MHPSPCGVSVDVQTEDMEAPALLHMFSKLPVDMHLRTLSRLFSSYLSATSSVSVPEDFLCLAAAAMVNLHNGGRSYNLAKGIGTQRQDKSETRFPIKQMPMGLIEYVTQFFAVDNLQQIKGSDVYTSLSNCCFYVDQLSSRLSVMATDHVLPLWPEMAPTTSWANVVCGF